MYSRISKETLQIPGGSGRPPLIPAQPAGGRGAAGGGEEEKDLEGTLGLHRDGLGHQNYSQQGLDNSQGLQGKPEGGGRLFPSQGWWSLPWGHASARPGARRAAGASEPSPGGSFLSKDRQQGDRMKPPAQFPALYFPFSLQAQHKALLNPQPSCPKCCSGRARAGSGRLRLQEASLLPAPALKMPEPGGKARLSPSGAGIWVTELRAARGRDPVLV